MAKNQTQRTYTEKEVEGIRRASYKKGVEHAAEVADQYNSSTTHPYSLGDCILGKLNQTERKRPRKNSQKLEKLKDLSKICV